MTITVLFNCGVEKVFEGVTKVKRSGDLKHIEIYYGEPNWNEKKVSITIDQIAMWEQFNNED